MKSLDHLNPDLQLQQVIHMKPGGLPRSIPDQMVVKLAPGNYHTSGIWIPEHLALIAEEPGTVKIKFTPNSPTDPNLPQIIARNSHAMLFYAYGIDFDCNWESWEERRKEANGNFKLGAISLRAWQMKVDSCTIRNFGADGSAYKDQGSEVFPLMGQSYSGPGPGEQLPEPGIEICNCTIKDPHFMSGGYCTAIHAQTNQTGAGDRFPIGQRTTIAAHIHHNTIRVPGGIGLGAGGTGGGTEQALFEHNDVKGKTLFNADTGKVYHLIIRDNKFEGSQGVNLTAGVCEDCHIVSNSITITEPFYNQVLEKDEAQWAVRIANNRGTVVNDNKIISSYGKEAQERLMLASYKGKNSFEDIGAAKVEPEPVNPAPDNKKLLSLKEELSGALKQIEELSKKLGVEKTDSELAINQLIDKLRKTQSQVFEQTKKLLTANEKLDSVKAAFKTLSSL